MAKIEHAVRLRMVNIEPTQRLENDLSPQSQFFFRKLVKSRYASGGRGELDDTKYRLQERRS